MKVLVTGGTGFIGEFFVPLLLKDGHTVRLLVRNVNKAKRLFQDRCEYIVGDLVEENTIEDCCEGVDAVFHMVAKVGNELPSEQNFKEFRLVNVEGTRRLMKDAQKHKVKRFIFVSSIAAMGIVKDNPICEKSRCEPYLPYQISKYEAEQVLLDAYKDYGFPVVIIRPTKVYGVGEREFSFALLSKLCKKHIFAQVGRESKFISNIYVTDLAMILSKLLDKGELGECYIATSECSIKLNKVQGIIAETLGINHIITFLVPRKIVWLCATIGERFFALFNKNFFVTQKNIEAITTDRIYDISKLKKDVGVVPMVSMEDGVAKTVQWYLDAHFI